MVIKVSIFQYSPRSPTGSVMTESYYQNCVSPTYKQKMELPALVDDNGNVTSPNKVSSMNIELKSFKASGTSIAADVDSNCEPISSNYSQNCLPNGNIYQTDHMNNGCPENIYQTDHLSNGSQGNMYRTDHQPPGYYRQTSVVSSTNNGNYFD